jgi:hypothetical protein
MRVKIVGWKGTYWGTLILFVEGLRRLVSRGVTVDILETVVTESSA